MKPHVHKLEVKGHLYMAPRAAPLKLTEHSITMMYDKPTVYRDGGVSTPDP